MEQVERKRNSGPSSGESHLKDALLAEYAAVRSEILLCIEAQKQVLGWMIPLVVAYVGSLVTLEDATGKKLLARMLAQEATEDTFLLVSVLTGAFILGHELLFSYWIYMLHKIFRLGNYVRRLSHAYASSLSVDARNLVFGWDLLSPGLHDIDWHRSLPKGVKTAVHAAAWMQPITLISFILFGLLTMGFALGGCGVYRAPLTGTQPTKNLLLLLMFACLLLVFSGQVVISLCLKTWRNSIQAEDRWDLGG